MSEVWAAYFFHEGKKVIPIPEFAVILFHGWKGGT